MKGLPVNRRAATLAATCGLIVESPFLGDVYVGRVAVQPAPMRASSFKLAEMDGQSPFLRSACVRASQRWHVAGACVRPWRVAVACGGRGVWPTRRVA